MSEHFGAAIAALSIPETAGVSLAVAYLVLAIRQNILCWAAAFFSSLSFMVVFHSALLHMESALQVFYAAMAVYGWRQWRYAGADGSGVRIHTWKIVRHIQVIGGVAGAALLLGWIMDRTDAALPYADAFTTVAAIAATFMVARKVLENWLYWFVIDGVSIYLYVARELYLTALLFAFYLVLIVIGFRRWRRDYLAGVHQADDGTDAAR